MLNLLRLTRPALATVLVLLWAGGASAAPVIFTLVSTANAGATYPSTQAFTPALPLIGGGAVDEALGTFTLTLPVYTVDIDILITPGVDASVLTTGWGQTGTFPGGVGGAVTSSSATGTSTCTPGPGGFGPFVCPAVPPAVLPWPPTGAAGPFGPAGATISLVDGPGFDGTITVNEPFDPSGGQVQSIYTYSIIPEPGTMLLLGMGLIGLASSGRRRA